MVGGSVFFPEISSFFSTEKSEMAFSRENEGQHVQYRYHSMSDRAITVILDILA